MNDSLDEQSFQNPFDAALDRWFGSFEEYPPPGVAHLSESQQDVLIAVVAAWQGVLDPNRQGINHCASTSYLVRNTLRLLAGVHSEPLTVTVDVTTATGVALTLGNRNPRMRVLPGRRHPTWTGHEIIYIPAWSLALDLTIGQVSSLYPALAEVLVAPATAKLTQTPRPGTTFTTTLRAWGVLPFGGATYTVCRPNYSYRDAQGWAAQQNDLDRTATRLVERIEAAGISSS